MMTAFLEQCEWRWTLPKKIVLSEGMYSELNENSIGICRACGFQQFGCEPDARNYSCQDCRMPEVFGVEELLQMGEIEFGEDEDV